MLGFNRKFSTEGVWIPLHQINTMMEKLGQQAIPVEKLPTFRCVHISDATHKLLIDKCTIVNEETGKTELLEYQLHREVVAMSLREIKNLTNPDTGDPIQVNVTAYDEKLKSGAVLGGERADNESLTYLVPTWFDWLYNQIAAIGVLTEEMCESLGFTCAWRPNATSVKQVVSDAPSSGAMKYTAKSTKTNARKR